MCSVTIRDAAPSQTQFLQDIVDGLQQPDKTLPCKYLYDERGSQLFEQICELDEYYLTRTELSIMRSSAGEMAEQLGTGCALVEYGSGSSIKTQILLDHLSELAGYVPVDISHEHLRQTSDKLAQRYPELVVQPVCADFTSSWDLPPVCETATRTAVYFPGSTIGNFGPETATELLATIGEQCGSGGGLLIGVDLRKSRQVLEPAYDDSQGVTEEFNRNLLVRINRELGADFDVDQFRHKAIYNADECRMEMSLVSQQDQTVLIDVVELEFTRGEQIHTEYSYKYSFDQLEQIAESAGFGVAQVWTDPNELFSVQYLTVI